MGKPAKAGEQPGQVMHEKAHFEIPFWDPSSRRQAKLSYMGHVTKENRTDWRCVHGDSLMTHEQLRMLVE
jgi:hypothetical protein